MKWKQQRNCLYDGYVIAFDGASFWSFGKLCDVYIVHQEVLKIVKTVFLIPGKGPTDDVKDSVGEPEKRFSTDFAKSKICKFKGLRNLTPIGFV